MSAAKFIGRIGALAITLGVGMTVATAPAVALAEPSESASVDSTALILGFVSVPTPDDALVESVKNQFIEPTHPGQGINYVAVTTPEEWWPITGVARLAGSAVGSPSIWGPGGPGWPDEPWWKLSGLFDHTWDQSVQAGLADLETAMAAHGNDHLVIYGFSQGATIANTEKRKLAEQYPAGTEAPDIDFVLGGDGNLPNGGLFARFPGVHVPIVDTSFNGPEPTDTQFDTVVITRQYDPFSDFPLYPLNLVADLNAVLGGAYVHTHPFDVSLPADPSTSPAYQGTHGDTSYYFFQTQHLPLFDPLRTLGVPEPLIDVVEPFFRAIVELGYDRTIPPWEPTPARLIPLLNPGKVTADLVAAVGEGINNAAALVGSPPSSSNAAPVTLAAPATQTDQVTSTVQTSEPGQLSRGTATSTMDLAETARADVSPQVTPATPAQTATENHQPTSLKNVSETAKATSTTASAVAPSTTATHEPSTGATTLKPAKPRPVVRAALGMSDTQLPEKPHRGDGATSTTSTAAVSGEAATGETSAPASSSASSSLPAAVGNDADAS